MTRGGVSLSLGLGLDLSLGLRLCMSGGKVKRHESVEEQGRVKGWEE